jgi:DNA-directed RNA polymerase beta' subunit
MTWINLDISLSNNDDKPRKLTEEEINYIIDDFPDDNVLNNEAKQIARLGVIYSIENELKKIEISPKDLDELKNIIRGQHIKSLVVPATAVGTTAAEAVGSTMTQSTLNTFHSSGSVRSVSFGIDTMRDILFARKTPKNVFCTVYYKNKLLTLEEVLETKSYIVGSVFSNFIVDFKIGKFGEGENNFKKLFWHEKSYIEEYIKDITYPENIDTSVILRIFLNKNEMYKHKVTIKKLVDVIIKKDNNIIPIYGSIIDGIIDIIPKTKINKDFLEVFSKNKNKYDSLNINNSEIQSYIENLYFEIFINGLKNSFIKGIEGITNLHPKVINVLDIIKDAKQFKDLFGISEGDAKQFKDLFGENMMLWEINLNSKIMKHKGLSIENLLNMLNKFNIDIIKTYDMSYIIRLPKTLMLEVDPKTYIDDFIKENPNPKFIHIKNLIKSIDKHNNDWVIKFDTYQLNSLKISNEHINYMFFKLNFKILQVIDQKIIIKLPNLNIEKPLEYLNYIEDLYENQDNIVFNDNQDFKVKNIKELLYNDNIITTNNINIYIEKYKLTEELFLNKLQSFFDIFQITHNITNKIDNIIINIQDNINNNPINYINHILSIDKKLYTDNKIKERTSRIKSSEFVIAETEGENLSKLLSLQQIDKTRTTCNNMFTIYNTFGIEASRKLIINSLMEVTEKSYVHPANLMIIAEFITSRGEPNGATYTGISRQPAGHLSLATLERAGKVFTQSAFCTSKEDIRNVSASIVVGTRMAIGDGMFDIGLDIDGKTYINDDIFKVKTNFQHLLIDDITQSLTTTVLDNQISLIHDKNSSNIQTTGLLYEPILITTIFMNIDLFKELNIVCDNNKVVLLKRSTRKINKF